MPASNPKTTFQLAADLETDAAVVGYLRSRVQAAHPRHCPISPPLSPSTPKVAGLASTGALANLWWGGWGSNPRPRDYE